MQNLKIKPSPDVDSVFKNYPDSVREKLLNLRRLIIEAANEIEEVKHVEETLKWGEPSYVTKSGSTIRIDWKKNKPEQYAIYFKCTSKLVSTFKTLYSNRFNFEGTRAIVFQMDDNVPEVELKNCIKAALTYHKVKQLPMLGL